MLAGGIIWHMFRALRRSLARVGIWFLVTGLIAAVVVEIVAIIYTHELPSMPTNVLAAALFLAVGYSTAFTVLVGEIFRDLFIAVGDLEKEVAGDIKTGEELVESFISPSLKQPARRA
jgi:hypothetical protein